MLWLLKLTKEPSQWDPKHMLIPMGKAKKKINKCFTGHFFEKQMSRQVIVFIFYFPKNRQGRFLNFLFHRIPYFIEN